MDDLFNKVRHGVDEAKKLVESGQAPEKLKEAAFGGFKTVQGLVDGNQDHNDPVEKHIDKIREEIYAQHRFTSFAAERQKNACKWYIDGHDYFWAVSEIFDAAKECIFILDWWLSPELYLRRPPSDYPDWRLDRLLKRKAEQGVKVYVIVYKEVTETMNMSSAHTKHALEALHPNIKVMRHPDHIGTEHTTEFWSHHEKVVIVDNHRACLGGLDLSFGRWDTHNHPLADVHPTDFTRTLFPGQDYNNARVLDFQQVDNFVSNQVSILETARMPWHDVHVALVGDAVLDMVQHFVERWNKIKKEKYSKEAGYDWLAFPHNVQAYPNEAIVAHPQRQQWEDLGTKFRNQLQSQFDNFQHPGGVSALTPYIPPPGAPADHYEDHLPHWGGSCNVQVVRSVSDWSHGTLTEHSIQNAYIQLIEEAQHFVYIENQFFVTNASDKGPVVNKIAKALTERIIRAARANQKFKVIVMLPEVPGFSGDIEKTDSITIIMGGQWRAINRGGHSIYEQVRAAGYDPLDYIRFYHLRSYDRINAPASFIQDMTQRSGKTFFQAQIAQARLFIGDDTQWHQDSIKINAPGTYNPDTKGDLGTTSKDSAQTIETVPFPPNAQAALQTVKQFESGASRSDDQVSDFVSQHALEDTTTLESEQWLGTEQEERDCYVSELLYIHAKIMIVDDRRVIMGSANINDRSQKGNGDSEIAVVIEDTDQIQSYMDGQPYTAGRFAASLRRKLMREHLGLLKPQVVEDKKTDEITSFMHAVPYPSDDETGLPEDQQVADPLSDKFLNYWNGTAQHNRRVFENIFKPVPTDDVHNWDQYKAYLPKVKVGHVATNLPLEQIKDQLQSVRGHLVTAPLDFLADEKSLTNDDNPNWLGLNPTLPIYI